jgi:hypothetical protein
MDDINHGVMTACLALQAEMLQTLVAKRLLMPAEALDIVDRTLAGVERAPRTNSEKLVAAVTRRCLEDVQEELAAIAESVPRTH